MDTRCSLSHLVELSSSLNKRMIRGIFWQVILLLSSLSVNGQDGSKKYPKLLKKITEINSREDFDEVMLKENSLKEIPNASRLFGFFKNDTIQKITLLKEL